ncbi:hypothetical protein BOTBODRAFT_173092 [Botryobasidium botryosum FD-172 SS1]|uniref:Uncharacterized protein n=1 Tax=Botryobasidium botryosum (strain FD-172 SS1) TaxID=930990 RepID=A0A067MYH1_BOTB1|nr:hypothetical protein BOTBODRAFT_173092 [Botryobasidium botryosum FD-172 SS1]
MHAALKSASFPTKHKASSAPAPAAPHTNSTSTGTAASAPVPAVSAARKVCQTCPPGAKAHESNRDCVWLQCASCCRTSMANSEARCKVSRHCKGTRSTATSVVPSLSATSGAALQSTAATTMMSAHPSRLSTPDPHSSPSPHTAETTQAYITPHINILRRKSGPVQPLHPEWQKHLNDKLAVVERQKAEKAVCEANQKAVDNMVTILYYSEDNKEPARFPKPAHNLLLFLLSDYPDVVKVMFPPHTPKDFVEAYDASTRTWSALPSSAVFQLLLRCSNSRSCSSRSPLLLAAIFCSVPVVPLSKIHKANICRYLSSDSLHLTCCAAQQPLFYPHRRHCRISHHHGHHSQHLFSRPPFLRPPPLLSFSRLALPTTLVTSLTAPTSILSRGAHSPFLFLTAAVSRSLLTALAVTNLASANSYHRALVPFLAATILASTTLTILCHDPTLASFLLPCGSISRSTTTFSRLKSFERCLNINKEITGPSLRINKKRPLDGLHTATELKRQRLALSSSSPIIVNETTTVSNIPSLSVDTSTTHPSASGKCHFT